jgi:hypothetical protein
MNIIDMIQAQFAIVRSAILARAGSLQDLRNDANALRNRALLIAQRSNERANRLENKVADLEAEIERLDADQDEANLIAVGAARLLGE